MKKTTNAVIATLAVLAFSSTALATMDIQKEYKAKNAKATCESCHKAKTPKKGAADLNEYGEKVKAAPKKDGKIQFPD